MIMLPKHLLNNNNLYDRISEANIYNRKGRIGLRILVVGDIVGEGGVKKLQETLPNLKRDKNIDFVIVNGENSADGMGITQKIFKNILTSGADVVTMGNHTWGKKDIFNFIDNSQLLVPANYPKGVLGNRYGVYEIKNKKIGVINLLGRTDMNVLTENPFIVVEEIINNIKPKTDIIIVDFHAEATAEKIAMGYYLDGKANILFGTHTHVQTADEKIMEKGTGYITDIGMTGPINSVIGMDVKASLKRFKTTLPEKYRVAEGKNMLNGCIFEVNDENCRVEKIERIKLQ